MITTTVQLSSWLVLYSCSLDYYCTVIVMNRTVQLSSWLLLYSRRHDYYCTLVVMTTTVLSSSWLLLYIRHDYYYTVVVMTTTVPSSWLILYSRRHDYYCTLVVMTTTVQSSTRLTLNNRYNVKSSRFQNIPLKLYMPEITKKWTYLFGFHFPVYWCIALRHNKTNQLHSRCTESPAHTPPFRWSYPWTLFSCE